MDNPEANQPSSGTYGEQADLNRLKQQLPGTVGTPPPPGAAQPAPPQISPQPTTAMPPGQGRPATGTALPPGIPSVIAQPTQQPDTPVGTPLSAPVAPLAPGAVAPDQSRIALLQALSQSPDVSATTRAWAGQVLHLLIGGQGQVLNGGQ